MCTAVLHPILTTGAAPAACPSPLLCPRSTGGPVPGSSHRSPLGRAHRSPRSTLAMVSSRCVQAAHNPAPSRPSAAPLPTGIPAFPPPLAVSLATAAPFMAINPHRAHPFTSRSTPDPFTLRPARHGPRPIPLLFPLSTPPSPELPPTPGLQRLCSLLRRCRGFHPAPAGAWPPPLNCSQACHGMNTRACSATIIAGPLPVWIPPPFQLPESALGRPVPTAVSSQRPRHASVHAIL